VIRIFVDGVQAGANISDSVNIQTSLGIRVGQSISNSTYKWAGWIEELRVVKGTAYFTTNFVPSTSAYGGDGTTIAAKQKLIVAESAAIVSYDINGTNRTVLATNITNEPHDFVQIGNTLYIQSQTDGLYSWVGTGSAVAVGSVSAPSALSITASTTIGGLTSGEDALVACKNSISRCELIACTATTGGTATALVQVPNDSTHPAGTLSLLNVYTVAPTAGTLVGTIGSSRFLAADTTPTTLMTEDHEILFYKDHEDGLVLRGITEGVTISFASAPATAVTMALEIVWTEADT